jgi:hypothetical protein
MTISSNPTNHIGWTDGRPFPLPSYSGGQRQFIPRLFFDSSDFSHCRLPAPTTRNFTTAAYATCIHQAFLRVQHLGRRMLFIRFVNRAVQAVRRSRPRRAAAGKR